MGKKYKVIRALDWHEARDQAVESKAHARRRPEKPLTDRHTSYLEAIESHPVVLCVGPAGTGKTSLACGVAVRMLKSGVVDHIVLTRPLVECDEEMGFLPGGIDEKTEPFMAPMVEALKEHLAPREFEEMKAAGTIVVCPLAVMRGKTFHRSFVILDESQNATYGQLKMAVTRLGHESRMVINGDVEQVDLEGQSPLVEVWRRLAAKPRHPAYAFVRFGEEEVLRPDLVRFAAKRLAGPACVSTANSSTITTRGPTEPAPSYGGAGVTAGRRSGSSSGCSKRPAG
jgi:phosphate starvation-inducible PhoH-like protein